MGGEVEGRGGDGSMTTTTDHGLTRRMWHQLEPIHAVFWYAPEVFAKAEGLGFDVQTRWPTGRGRPWVPIARSGWPS
jgi:hypothetical protein